jgi:hypothetical protein
MRTKAGAFLVLLGALLALWAVGRALLEEPEGSSAAPGSSPSATPERGGPARLAAPGSVAATASTALDAGEERRDAEGTALVGFVLSEVDGAPVRDAWATLNAPLPLDWNPDRDPKLPPPLAECGTDSAGRFALPWPSEPRTTVTVEAPYGWILTSPRLLETPAQPTDPALQFRARPLRKAHVELALLDLRTGEPIPHYMIGLRQGPMTAQLLVSDEHGIARSELPLAEGFYQVSLTDDHGMGRSGGSFAQGLDFDGLETEQPLELQIPVGPTYLLDLRSPTDLSGKLVHANLADIQEAPGLIQAQDGAPVRTDQLLGGWPWVRFHARWVRWQIDREDELVLVVSDQARKLHGEARVPATWGFHPAPVRVDLAPTGTLEVEIVDRVGRAVASAEVSLASSKDALPSTLRSGSDGLAVFEGLPARSYWLHVGHLAFQPADASASVSAGRTARVRVRLDPARIAGTVEGRVIGGSRCASDMGFALRARLALTSLDGSDRGFMLPLEFERQGEALIARFRFTDVPAGEYALSMSDTDPRLWWPPSMLVRPPAANLELSEVALDALIAVAPRAVDATTGEDLFDGWLWLQVEGCRARLHSLGFHQAPLVQHGVHFAWGVGAVGHVPRFGTEADLELGERGLTAELALARGCGLRVDVVGAEGEPLEAVAVFADGAQVGATNAQGSFLFVRSEPPDALEVRPGAGASVGVLEAWLAGEPVRAVRVGPH